MTHHDPQAQVAALYASFNRRDIEAVLEQLHPEVDWPNGWEGGRIHGREAVRDYWTRQWAAIDPTVTPVRVEAKGNRTTVHVHATVRHLDGQLISEKDIQHVYTFEDGLVRRMDIVH